MNAPFSIPFFKEKYGLELSELEEVWAGNDLLFRAQLVDNEQVALKIFRSSNAPDATRAAGLNRWLEFLKTEKIASVGPAVFLNGKPSASFRTWISGEKIKMPTVAFCRKLGETTARLHRASEKFSAENLVFETTRIDHFFIQKIGKMLLPEAQKMGIAASLFQQKIDSLEAFFSATGEAPDAFGLIHSDLHFGNLLRKKGSNRLVVLDWDEIAFAPFLLDFGPVLAEFTRFPCQKAAFENAFFEGYLSKKTLPRGFEKHLASVRSATGLLAASWFFSPPNTHVRAMPERADFGEKAFASFLNSDF